MNKTLTIAVAGLFATLGAMPVIAQENVQQVPASPSANPSTIDETGAEQTGAINRVELEIGENSFTEGQAQERIQASGFTNVSDLKLDADGIWRGTAMKGATTVDIGLDYKGNVATSGR